MKATDARSRKSLISFGVTALLALGAASAQIAMAASTTGIDNTGNYQSEVHACLTGQTQQDRATCLKEARNAHADKVRGVLTTRGDLQANALARCDVFDTAADKEACHDRVVGMGTIDGSVASGGILRSETTTTVLGNR